ncbi:ARM repeat superfamily protein [Rhynchospora pubera]|uniref:ARM repeat superfamily protein n=1 Tax=Rhynchospora pubera TaxID=906938 RepID=A0AAV8D0Y6_9POAL|nr:ARM repeat superfamily protein [Rhynchospora pubera]
MKQGEEQEEGNHWSTLAKSATELIESLIYTSDSIRLFPARWRSIKNRLEQLNSTLSLLSEENNLELTDLLQDILSTCRETQLLAGQCHDDTYNRGNLFLRSDLNVIISKIDCHISHLERIYASGVITQTKSSALVVSKPGPGATRDEIRFFLRDLFERLKIGDSEMRIQSMCMLNEALHENEMYVKIISHEEEGIDLLVNLIEFGDCGVIEQALETISTIVRYESHRNTLVIHGIISPLVKIMESGKLSSKERAASVLNKLTENCNNAWSVSAQGGINVLLKNCSDTDASRELVRLSCEILKNLNPIEEIRNFMLESNAIEILSKLVTKSNGHDETMQIRVIELLTTLSSGEEYVVELLVCVLDPSLTRYTNKTREVAAKSIEHLCFSSKSLVKKLIRSGFINHIVYHLRNCEVSMQQTMLKAACYLCRVSQEAKVLFGQLGFMSDLIRIIESKACEHEIAAEALSGMISLERNKKKFIQGDSNVARILKLLVCEEEKVKKYLLLVLVELSDSSSGRRKIGACEYVKNLESLAQNDNPEAKKILKRISGNKFMGILNGIWS